MRYTKNGAIFWPTLYMYVNISVFTFLNSCCDDWWL